MAGTLLERVSFLKTNANFVTIYGSLHPIAEQDCAEFVAVLATTDGAEKTEIGGEDEGITVTVAREEVLKDDVGAVDPDGELVEGELTGDDEGEADAEREVTRDEVSAKVSAEVGAKLTDENVVRVHREDEVRVDQVVWDHKPVPVPVSSAGGEGGMLKQRTVPSCLRARLSTSSDPPVILAWKHDCAGCPRHCLLKLDT